MKKLLLFAMSLGFAFTACSKEEVELFDTKNTNYIQFVDASTDTSAFSFMFHPEVADGGSYDLAIPVKILGLAHDVDREFKIEVIAEATSAETKHFALPESFVMRAGMYEDTVFIKLYRTPDLKTSEVSLGIRIIDNAKFLAGVYDYRERHWVISDKIAQPEWWNSTVVSTYLGSYSDKKYDLLIRVTGVSDWSELSADEMRFMALQLKRYLAAENAAGRPVYEDAAGTELMNVTVKG